MTNIVKNKNGIEFDIDAIATDLNGKMDRDGVNAETSVKAFDGAWIEVYEQILDNGSMAAETHTIVDLSNILPNDNYNYECLFRLRTSRGDSSGTNNYFCITKTTTIAPTSVGAAIVWGCAEADGANFQQSSANVTIPIGQERNVRLSNLSYVSGCYAWLIAYRRIGTNQ